MQINVSNKQIAYACAVIAICIIAYKWFKPTPKHFSDAGIAIIKEDAVQAATQTANKRKAYEDAKKAYVDKYSKFLQPSK